MRGFLFGCVSALVFLASTAHAQYPSPIVNNLTVNGFFQGHNGAFSGTLDVGSMNMPGKVCNVAYYGAVGNGIANDHDAIQAAVDAAAAAGGGQVYFPIPAVAYYISGPITIPYVIGGAYGSNPYQPPIRLFGVGPARKGVNTLVPSATELISLGSVIDCRNTGGTGGGSIAVGGSATGAVSVDAASRLDASARINGNG